MAFYLADYEAKYGKLIIEDFTRPKISSHFISVLLVVFIGTQMGLLFLMVDFSRHPTLSYLPWWALKLAGLVFLLEVVYLVYGMRSEFPRHGLCLFVKGVLDDGSWGFDDENSFVPFVKIEMIVIAPSRGTATRIHKAILSVGYGRPLNEGDGDWAISDTVLENDIRASFGKVLVVQKPNPFEHDYFTIRISDIRNLDRLRAELMALALKNRVPFVDESQMSWANEDLKPKKLENIAEAEREYGRMVYEDFRVRDSFFDSPSHLFEKGILRCESWPFEPSEYHFIFFQNLEAILVAPTKETAKKYHLAMDQVFNEIAHPEKKMKAETDPAELDRRVKDCDKEVEFIYKYKRVDDWGISVKGFKDLRKFVGLVRPLAEKYGVGVIDESHLPGATGEKIKLA